MSTTSSSATTTTHLTASESKQVALHGHRALTPILSGAISGGVVGVAWIVGIIVWLYKRHRRARRAKAAGFRSYREFLDPPKTHDAFIIPPDPAVLGGQARPGEKIIVEENKGKDMIRHVRTASMTESDAEQGRAHHEKMCVSPGVDLRAPPALCRVPDGRDSTTVGSDESSSSRDGV